MSQPNYGLPNSKIVGAPRFVRLHTSPIDGATPTCPHCGCVTLCEIECDCEQPLLRGGKGTGTYLSCPACPWASPMMIAATAAPPVPTAAKTLRPGHYTMRCTVNPAHIYAKQLSVAGALDTCEVCGSPADAIAHARSTEEN